MKPVNAPPTANPGTHLPREKPNNPKQQGGKPPNRWEHKTNNIIHILQTTDTPPSQENATEGADTEDGSAAIGVMSGLARSDTPGRVFPHLPRQRRNSQVLHQSPKHTGPHLKDTRQSVPCQLGLEPLKTFERRQRVFQYFCRKPHHPYAYRIRRHTRGMQDETMAETQLGTPIHPQPDLFTCSQRQSASGRLPTPAPNNKITNETPTQKPGVLRESKYPASSLECNFSQGGHIHSPNSLEKRPITCT
jgi:hypothetical protein